MLNSHDLYNRQVFAAARELDALHQKRYKIKTLEQPYQRGWRRYYTLSDRTLDHQDRPTLEAILEVIGNVVVHHSRNFQRRRGRTRKLCEIEQLLRPIPLHEWQRKNYPDVWHRYFQYQLLLERNHHWQPYWVFAQPSLYRLKIGRNWIYQVQEIDPEIESRLGELDRWFELHQGWRRYGWLKGRRQSYRWSNGGHKKQRFLINEHRREIASAYLTFPEVDPAASTRRIRTSLRPISPNLPGVAQCRGNELRPRPVQVQVLPPGPWNVNRTSAPGFFAKEIVPHHAGWGACPPRSATFLSDRVAQLAEARRRERRKCWFNSSRDHPFSDPKLRQRSIRLLTGRAGRTSLRVHHFRKQTPLPVHPPIFQPTPS